MIRSIKQEKKIIEENTANLSEPFIATLDDGNNGVGFKANGETIKLTFDQGLKFAESIQVIVKKHSLPFDKK